MKLINLKAVLLGHAFFIFLLDLAIIRAMEPRKSSEPFALTKERKSQSLPEIRPTIFWLLQTKCAHETYLRCKVDFVLQGGRHEQLERLRSFYVGPVIAQLKTTQENLKQLTQDLEVEAKIIAPAATVQKKIQLAESAHIMKNRKQPTLLLWCTAAIFGSAYTMSILHWNRT